MRTLRLVAWLAVCSPSGVRADPEPAWQDVAAAQLRTRLDTEWTALVTATTTAGWTVVLPHGRRFTGGWAMRFADGWTYLFDGGTVRCRIQPGTPAMVTCDDGDFVEDTVARVAIGRATRPRSLATLLTLHRGVFGKSLTADAAGRAVVETIVSEPPASSRRSRRYRAAVTLSTTGFAVGTPVLVEEYRETCFGVHGCHDVHWSCLRAR